MGRSDSMLDINGANRQYVGHQCGDQTVRRTSMGRLDSALDINEAIRKYDGHQWGD